MEYVFTTAATTGRPSVTNMSFGFNDPSGALVAIDLAVAQVRICANHGFMNS